MGLCGPNRCGCAWTSTTFTLSGSGEPGDPLQIETYDGVATEIPDTRPALAVRFEGMRVHCTDTDCTYLWSGDVWRCISQPLTPVGLSHTLTLGTGGHEAAGYSRSGHQVMLQYEAALGTGFTVNVGFFTPPVPAKWTGERQLGSAQFYDVSTSLIYHGTCDLHYSGQIRLYAPPPGVFTPSNTNPYTWEAGDQLWWKLVYDAADDE